MTSDAKERLLVALTFASSTYLFFNFAVWGTDLAMTPVREIPCLGLWGQLSCMSHPMVLIVTLVAAAIVTSSVWTYLRAGLVRWAVLVLAALVAGSVYITVFVKPHCGGGLNLGVEMSYSDPAWACLGGIR